MLNQNSISITTKFLNITKKMVLGTAQFGMHYGIANRKGQVYHKEISAILDLAWDNGIDTLDTAKAHPAKAPFIILLAMTIRRLSF